MEFLKFLYNLFLRSCPTKDAGVLNKRLPQGLSSLPSGSYPVFYSLFTFLQDTTSTSASLPPPATLLRWLTSPFLPIDSQHVSLSLSLPPSHSIPSSLGTTKIESTQQQLSPNILYPSNLTSAGITARCSFT